jgi:hypothetical protein
MSFRFIIEVLFNTCIAEAGWGPNGYTAQDGRVQGAAKLIFQMTTAVIGVCCDFSSQAPKQVKYATLLLNKTDAVYTHAWTSIQCCAHV